MIKSVGSLTCFPSEHIKSTDERMSKTERQGILVDAIKTFGEDVQIIKAIEEMAELTKALCKLRTNPPGPELRAIRENAIEEIGDVQIMLDQLRLIIDCDTTETEEQKLKRLAQRVDYHKQEMYAQIKCSIDAKSRIDIHTALQKNGRARMTAVYVGEDGSCGFRSGFAYYVTVIYAGGCLMLRDGESEKACPYSSLDELLENWDPHRVE